MPYLLEFDKNKIDVGEEVKNEVFSFVEFASTNFYACVLKGIEKHVI